MYDLVSERVFPFLRALDGTDSSYAQHMRDARFTIPRSMLARVVDQLAWLRATATQRRLVEQQSGRVNWNTAFI